MSSRGQWKSKLGFIMAASGSAIGLGNIVFFSANAYKFGGGAFYLPYLVALLVIGIPVMILEFGLGHHTGRAFPESMYRTSGKKGEFVGWWAVLNAAFITMYYITILGWVVGMWFGCMVDLFDPSVAVPAFGLQEGTLPNPVAFFFRMLSGWQPVLFVVLVWVINVLMVWWGTRSIEKAVKIFVPLMWIFMIVLIVRGLTLPNGIEGVYLLFTPNFAVMREVEVWQGAFSQMFFTLSLGFGVMTAYASYLAKDSDQTSNSVLVSCMNCGFEFIAGLAVFSLLFAMSMAPKASTLSMMFFVVPSGIAQFPAGVVVFGLIFFTLLLMAGLSSSVSLIEALASAVIDKYGMSRAKAVTLFSVVGCGGSVLFALPLVIDKALDSNGTLGLTLLDLMDHYAFSYGLLIVGVAECLLVGWVYGVPKIRETINKYSRLRLGAWYDWLVAAVIPALVLFVIGYAIYKEIGAGHLYGGDYKLGGHDWIPATVLAVWLCGTVGLSLFFTFRGEYKTAAKPGEWTATEEER